MWLPALTDFLSSCLSVYFVQPALRGPQLRTLLSCCETCWEDVEPLAAVALRGFCSERTKKKKKKILVVSNLICFHGSVFMARAAKQLAIADCSCAVVKPYNMMTKPTNRMEDGRRNMHCTVMYWNILHEASIPTIKVETSTLSLLFVKQF